MTDTPKDQPARRRAVAMRYRAGEANAPRVVAKGQGVIADRIIELARVHGLHVHEDPDLVALLGALEVDTDIPPELYRAVAEVLAFVYRLDRRLGESPDTGPVRR